MNDVSSFALAKIREEPVPARPDFEYLRSIHVRMFGDLLPNTAGKIRDVDVQATGTGIPYCRPEYIDANLTTLFRKLEREDYLTGLDADTFAERFADRWRELSAIHSWRDGNTRSQSIYVAGIAERAGHPIDWECVDVDELRTARLHAVAGNDRPLAAYLRAHLRDEDLARGQGDDATGARVACRREEQEHAVLRGTGYDPDAPAPVSAASEQRQRDRERWEQYRPPSQTRDSGELDR
jgi:cell filamentation protein